MKKNDDGIGELIDLLKTHPELINALVLDPKSINDLLSKSARRLLLGVDTKAFLKYVADPGDGGPVALCRKRTRALCPKTKVKYELRGCRKNTESLGPPKR